MSTMRSQDNAGKLLRQSGVFVVLALLLTGCGDLGLMHVNFQPEAPAEADRPRNDKKLDNRLLDELRNYVEEAEDFDELGADPDELLKTLDEADKVLTRIKRENRIALANANRQTRTQLPGRSPNIVMIVAPRLGVRDLGAYGQDKIPTPHLDALAKQGVQLTDFYAGAPTPRASQWTLQTGLTASRSRDDFLIEEKTDTLAETLWQGGYHTAFFGMWMAPDNATASDTPLKHGFDTWLGQLHAEDAATAYPESIWINNKLTDLPKSDEPVGIGELITQAAIEEMEAAADVRPFFSLIVLPPYLEMAADFAGEKLSDKTDWPAEAQSYGAAVRMTDRDVGRIRAAIERLGLTRRTAVLFTALSGSDEAYRQANDYFESTKPYRTHESKLGEGNLRVPFFAAFPGFFPAGRKVSRPAAMWDLLPTLTRLTFTQTPRKFFDGVSFATLLRTDKKIPPHLLYWETTGGKAQAVRLGRWKGLRPAGSETLQLYDLESDAGETDDVAEEHPEIILKLVRPEGRDAK